MTGSQWKKRVLVVLVVLIAAYTLAVAWVMVRETQLVFVGSNVEDSPFELPPDNIQLSWDTLTLPSADSSRVLLLEVRDDAAADSLWAIYFHGGGSLLGSEGNTNRYRLLLDAGFNVLAMEFRGYGAAPSDPPPTEHVLYRDAQTSWEYLTGTRSVDRSRVILYGWSLGGGVATHLAARVQPAALVTEGTFTALPEIGAARYPWLPARLLMQNRFDNLSRAAEVSVPWILLHGRHDETVSTQHAESMAAAAPRASVVWMDAGHDDAPTADPATITRELNRLASALRPEGS